EVWLFGEQQGSQLTSSFGAGRNPNGLKQNRRGHEAEFNTAQTDPEPIRGRSSSRRSSGTQATERHIRRPYVPSRQQRSQRARARRNAGTGRSDRRDRKPCELE